MTFIMLQLFATDRLTFTTRFFMVSSGDIKSDQNSTFHI